MQLFSNYTEAKKFYCIDFTNILNKNITSVYYTSEVLSKNIEIFIKYDYDYLATKNETYKQKLLNSIELLYFYVLQLSFSPSNYLNPIDINLEYDFFYINQKTKNENYLKYAETRLEQDDNFIFSSKSEIHSKITLQKKKQDYLPRVDKSDDLVFFELSLDGLYYNKYTRVYKKLPEVLAQVFGIMQPLMIAISFMVQYFSKYNLYNFLLDNFLCYFTKDNNKVDVGIWKYQKYKDFKNLFKNFITDNQDNKQSILVNKHSNINPNDNSNEKLDVSNFLYNNNFDQQTDKRLINDFNNQSLSYEDIKIQNKKDFIKEIDIEMVDKRIKNKITYDKIADKNPLNIIACKSQEISNKKEKKEKKIESLSISSKIKYTFPYIGFADYYLSFLISKNNHNYKSRKNNSKILKYFSNEILQKLDLFYYLKLVRTMEILKNIYIRKLAQKEDLQFLLKYLYYVRDCDLESILEKLVNKSK